MQTGYASIYVPIRRTLNYIEASLSQLLEFSLFQPNDALLWTSIAAIGNQFLAGLWGQNAFAGNNSTQAYYVICNSSNNTPQTISQGIVNTTVGVALLYPAEFINLTIAQFQSTGATTVTSIT
jgi:phage tail sheath protein FI